MGMSAAWLGLLQEGVPEGVAPLSSLPLLVLSGSHSLQYGLSILRVLHPFLTHG